MKKPENRERRRKAAQNYRDDGYARDWYNNNKEKWQGYTHKWWTNKSHDISEEK